MLSGNKYTSRSSLGSTIYQCLHQIPKETIYLLFMIGSALFVINYMNLYQQPESSNLIRSEHLNLFSMPRVNTGFTVTGFLFLSLASLLSIASFSLRYHI